MHSVLDRWRKYADITNLEKANWVREKKNDPTVANSDVLDHLHLAGKYKYSIW
jgi:hypothetical protein